MTKRCIETCPTCHVVFSAPTYKKNGKKTTWKKCPNGHEHTTNILRRSRYTKPKQKFQFPTEKNWLTSPLERRA